MSLAAPLWPAPSGAGFGGVSETHAYTAMSMLLPGAGALPPVASWDPEGDAPLEVPPAVRAAAAAGVQRVRDARPAEACRLDFLLEAVSADLPVEAPHAGHRPDWGGALGRVASRDSAYDAGGYASADDKPVARKAFDPAAVVTGPRRVSRPARLSSPEPDVTALPASLRRLAVPPVSRPRSKVSRAPRPPSGPRPATSPAQHGARGAALRWTPEEDAVLAVAVAENRKAPDKRSLNGIQWAAIQRRAHAEYPLLLRHLTSARGSKTCAKRWCQYLNPDDQLNKSRRWR